MVTHSMSSGVVFFYLWYPTSAQQVSESRLPIGNDQLELDCLDSFVTGFGEVLSLER